jgi:hypothetical protein
MKLRAVSNWLTSLLVLEWVTVLAAVVAVTCLGWLCMEVVNAL